MSGIIRRDAEYLLWGCGEFGRQFYDLFKDKIKITGYIDSNSNLWGEVLNTLPIISPEEIPRDKVVIVTSSWYNDISGALTDKGFVEGQGFWDYYSFMVRYMYECNHEIYIPSAGFQITEKCTLRCRHCIAQNPYISKPINYDVEELLNSLIPFFERGGKIGNLFLTGGDAFCHPQLADIVEVLGQKYLNKHIERISVSSNAILVPCGGEICDVLKRYGVVVRITDYRESTDKQKLEEMTSLCKKYGIQVELVNQGQWLQVWRKETEYLCSEKARIEMYKSCRYTGSAMIKNGRYYSCCVAGYADDNIAINFKELDKYTDEDIVQFIINGPCETGYETCAKCYGMTNSNKNYIPKGEQL